MENKIKQGWIEVSPKESNLEIIDLGERHFRRKKAFITGIAGQDGSYLAEYLLELGYEVHGIVRRNSTPENQDLRLANIENEPDCIYTLVQILLQSLPVLSALQHTSHPSI